MKNDLDTTYYESYKYFASGVTAYLFTMTLFVFNTYTTFSGFTITLSDKTIILSKICSSLRILLFLNIIFLIPLTMRVRSLYKKR